MIRHLRVPLALATALALGASARADVIYSSFGRGMSYGDGNLAVGGPNSPLVTIARGYQFTAAIDGQVASYDLALRTSSTLPAGAFTIHLVADASGEPDFAAVLDSATIDLASINLTTIYNIASSTGASLTAGAPYWIITSIAGDGWIDWKQGDPGLPQSPFWSNYTGLPEPGGHRHQLSARSLRDQFGGAGRCPRARLAGPGGIRGPGPGPRRAGPPSPLSGYSERGPSCESRNTRCMPSAARLAVTAGAWTSSRPLLGTPPRRR